MRHQRKRYKLGRTHAHRKATLAALSNALITHKRVTTTVAKAKALRIYIEPLINRAKEDTTHNRRQVFRHLQNKVSVTELFGEIAEKVQGRPGGYTRVIRLGHRSGDGADLAMIELVDYNDVRPEGAGGDRRRRTRRGSRRRGKGKAAEAAMPVRKKQATEAEVADTAVVEPVEESETTDVTEVAETTSETTPVDEIAQPEMKAANTEPSEETAVEVEAPAEAESDTTQADETVAEQEAPAESEQKAEPPEDTDEKAGNEDKEK